MNTPTSTSPIIEKLRKLIAHEQSARSIGNMNEAEAFAGKIQELLTSHKLSMSEVEFETRETTEPIDWERVNLRTEVSGSNRANIAWRVYIARAIALANSCVVVNARGCRGTSFFFVGRTSDRELSKMLYVYLIDLGEEMAAKSAKDNRKIQQLKFNVDKDINSFNLPPWAAAAFNSWMKQYRESWKTGFGEVVSKRITTRYEEMLKAQHTASGETGALVHIRKDALAVRNFLAGKVSQGRGRMSADQSNADGLAHGRKTGSAVNLSPNRFGESTGRTSRLLGA